MQVECADYVILNKADQLPQGGDAMQQLMAIVASLNPLATVIPATQCKVSTWHVRIQLPVHMLHTTRYTPSQL